MVGSRSDIVIQCVRVSPFFPFVSLESVVHLEVLRVLRRCFKDFFRLFQGRFRGVSRVFQGCFKDVSWMF